MNDDVCVTNKEMQFMRYKMIKSLYFSWTHTENWSAKWPIQTSIFL